MNVVPEYSWLNNDVRRVTTLDAVAGAGTVGDPIVLAKPATTACDMDGKIYPFKVMRGTQPVCIYTDSGSDICNDRYMLVPKLFGKVTTVAADGDTPAKMEPGFWGDVDGHEYATPADDATVAMRWNKANYWGAQLAGQIAGNSVDDAYADLASGFVVGTDWEWLKTEMWMQINHEVAPSGMAIGSGGCSDCHGSNPSFPMADVGYDVPCSMDSCGATRTANCD